MAGNLSFNVPPEDVDSFDRDIFMNFNTILAPRPRMMTPEDDVIVCSPRTFAAAKLRRILQVVDLDIDDSGDSQGQESEELPQPVQQAPALICPVCMEPVKEETSTKCGHIFCKECITDSIKMLHKCPTCRRRLNAKDTIRIYLPDTQN